MITSSFLSHATPVRTVTVHDLIQSLSSLATLSVTRTHDHTHSRETYCTKNSLDLLHQPPYGRYTPIARPPPLPFFLSTPLYLPTLYTSHLSEALIFLLPYHLPYLVTLSPVPLISPFHSTLYVSILLFLYPL